MNYKEFLQRAIGVANAGLTQPNTINESDVEPLVPIVFQDVGMRLASSRNTRSLLRRTKTVAFTAGSATLSADVLTAYTCESTLYDSSDTTKLYSWVPEWEDFTQSQDTRLGYFNVNESTITVIEPGEIYSDPGLNGSRSLVIPCEPNVPTTINAAIDARDEVIDNLVQALAQALKGMPPVKLT